MNKKLQDIMLASCSCSLIALSQGIQAQTAGNERAPLEEIVVTAQKREQRLLDVPVSVDVVNADQLNRQNISDISGLSQSVPSLGPSVGTAGVSIRGVSTSGFARSSEASVSVVLDGVVLGRAQVDELYDIERVEVLAGPQGMLFGKNASAGVINIVSKAPNPMEFEMKARMDYGNFDYQRQRVSMNVPLAENAAVRVGLNHRKHSGVVVNALTGDDQEVYSYGGRMRLLWEPSSKLSVNLSADWQNDGGNGIASGTFGIAGPGVEMLLANYCPGVVAGPTNNKNCVDGVPSRNARDVSYGYSAQLDYYLDSDYTLTSITANRTREIGKFDYKGLGGDVDLLPLDIWSTNLAPSDIDTFSQEFRIANPAGEQVEFVAGLYFTDTDTKDLIVQGGRLAQLMGDPTRYGRGTHVDIDQRSYAAFGQATIHATENLAFIVGGRYIKDQLDDVVRAVTPAELADYGFVQTPSWMGLDAVPVDVSLEESNFSWRLGAQYYVKPELMTYFTASRGYKGHAVNDQASPPLVQAVIEPEIPMYYELGAKLNFYEGRLWATAALFHNKVKDFQTDIFVPSSPTRSAGFSQGNASHMTSRGLELNVFGSPTPELTFNAGLLYNKAEYASDFLVSCNAMQTPGQGSCSVDGTTHAVDQAAGIPEWRALVNGEYAKPITHNLIGFVQMDYVFSSEIHLAATPDPVLHMDDQKQLGARVGLRHTEGAWELSLFGRNLLNNAYPYFFSDPLASLNGGGSYWTFPSLNWHRTYGLSLDVQL